MSLGAGGGRCGARGCSRCLTVAAVVQCEGCRDAEADGAARARDDGLRLNAAVCELVERALQVTTLAVVLAAAAPGTPETSRRSRRGRLHAPLAGGLAAGSACKHHDSTHPPAPNAPG